MRKSNRKVINIRPLYFLITTGLRALKCQLQGSLQIRSVSVHFTGENLILTGTDLNKLEDWTAIDNAGAVQWQCKVCRNGRTYELRHVGQHEESAMHKTCLESFEIAELSEQSQAGEPAVNSSSHKY
jgi:hypothetical protein